MRAVGMTMIVKPQVLLVSRGVVHLYIMEVTLQHFTKIDITPVGVLTIPWLGLRHRIWVVHSGAITL